MEFTSIDEILQSPLKLQSLDDASGLFEWTRKIFTLNIQKSTLSSSAIDSSSKNEFSISGAVAAKEWSLSTPVAGYGFDLIWASGNIWSFLADNESLCRQWVNALNASLKFVKLSGTSTPSPFAAREKSDVTVIASPAGTAVLTDETFRQPHVVNAGTVKTPLANRLSQRAAFDDLSEIGHISSNAASNEDSPQSDTSSSSSALAVKLAHESQLNAPAPPPVLPAQYNIILPNEKLPMPKKNTSEPAISYKLVNISQIHEEYIDPAIYDELRSKYLELVRSSQKDRAEVAMTKDQLIRTQEEMGVRASLLEDELKVARERFAADNEAIRMDIEKRLLRSETNATSIHQATTAALRAQHEREMSCLREELAAERKRSTELLHREKTLLDESLARESQLRFEMQSVQDSFQRLDSEVIKLREFGKVESQRWQKEKASMTAESERYIDELTRERDALLLKCQEEVRSKVMELSGRFEDTVKDIEGSMVETYRREFEAEKFRALSQAQKQCVKDIESVRSEERRSAVREIENVRKVFLDRERQTAEDFVQLEKLHNERVAGLEGRIAALQHKYEGAESVILDLKQRMDGVVTETKHGQDIYSKNLNEHMHRGHVLTLQLKEAHAEIQALKAREADYREKLTKAIEETRIQHAELIEVKRQASEAAAEAISWRKAANLSEESHIPERSALQIARDEVTILEHELRRLREDNWNLQHAADRAVQKIFGKNKIVSATSSKLTKSLPRKVLKDTTNEKPDLLSRTRPRHGANVQHANMHTKSPGWYPAGVSSRSNSKSRSLSPTINNKVSFAEVGNQFKPDLSATAGYSNKFKLSSSGK